MNTYLKVLTIMGAITITVVVAFAATQDKQTLNNQHVDVNQGMVAVIDNESGELRAPTVDEARRYQTPTQFSRSPLAVERRDDGSESMKLDDRYMTYSTITRRADGTWSRRCSMDHDHAQHVQKAVQ